MSSPRFGSRQSVRATSITSITSSVHWTSAKQGTVTAARVGKGNQGIHGLSPRPPPNRPHVAAHRAPRLRTSINNRGNVGGSSRESASPAILAASTFSLQDTLDQQVLYEFASNIFQNTWLIFKPFFSSGRCSCTTQTYFLNAAFACIFYKQ